jgi:hypothetical protein
VPKFRPPFEGELHRRVNDGILPRLLVRENFLRRLIWPSLLSRSLSIHSVCSASSSETIDAIGPETFLLPRYGRDDRARDRPARANRGDATDAREADMFTVGAFVLIQLYAAFMFAVCLKP